MYCLFNSYINKINSLGIFDMTSNNNLFTNINEIIDNTIEGILIIENGFIKHVNKPLMEILCYEDESELIGNLAIGILVPTSKERFIRYNSKTFQEISLLNKNANIIPAIIKIKDIHINNISYKMVSILDLSEVKKNEKIVLEQSKLAAMGEMLSIIAHQWRQPLSTIGAIVTRLKLKYELKSIDIDFYDEKITLINEHIQYMSNTIDHFRDFLKKNDNKKEFVKLDEVFYDSYKLVKNSFETQGIIFEINTLSSLKNIYLCRNDLLQIILNILNNAKDAFSINHTKNPKITISFFQDDLFQTIKVLDNAGGIDESIIDNIFTPYFSTKKEKNGTGLGLYICKMILEKHLNGQISVENIDNGALFTIKIAL